MFFSNLYKFFQRKYYDIKLRRLLSPIYVVYAISILLVFICGQIFLRRRDWDLKSSFSSFENIARQSFQDKLCQLSPIDVVYTWVNGSDPAFLNELEKAMQTAHGSSAANDTTASRFRDKEELRYSLRSLEKFAPWVRHVYIVTNGQIPYWLDLDSPLVTLVTHDEIFPNTADLPTFSSPAIEAHLHRIPGLSEKFIYFNDDILLGKEIWPEDFYTLSKGYKVFLTWTIPDCSPECPWAWVGDGTCDSSCNIERCFYDHGDCKEGDKSPQYPKYEGQAAPKSSPLDEGANIEAGVEDEIESVKNIYKQLRKQPNRRKLLQHNLQSGKVNAGQNTYNYKTKKLLNQSVINNSRIILSREKLYQNPVIDNNNKAKLFDLIKKDNVTVSEAVRLSNLKYLEAKKAQRLQKKVKMKRTKDTAIGGKMKDIVLDVLPDQIQFLRNGSIVEHINLEDVRALPTIIICTFGSRCYCCRKNFFVGKLLYDLDVNLHGLLAIMDKLRQAAHCKRINKSSIRNQSSSGKSPKIKPNWKELKLTPRNGQRHLDMFGESLLYVNGLYNREFGVQIRKVPAHMPHLLDRKILQNLQLRFPNQWRQTSANKLRHKTDMQLAFSYFYYLMSLTVNKTTSSVFDQFDTDHSGTLSDREIRTILTKLYGTPLTLSAVLEFEDLIKNCSKSPGYSSDITAAPYDRYADSSLPPVTKNLIKTCQPLVELLAEEFSAEKIYKYEVVYEKNQDAVFKGIVNNLSLVLDALDQIRANEKKFICLNDNIMTKPGAKPTLDEDIIVAVLQDFYQSLFPTRSSFELPPHVRNRFLHISDYNTWQRNRMLILGVLSFILVFCCCFCVYSLTDKNNPWLIRLRYSQSANQDFVDPGNIRLRQMSLANSYPLEENSNNNIINI